MSHSYLLELPAELLQKILEWVDLEGLLTCALVCRGFKIAARKDRLWIRFLKPDWENRRGVYWAQVDLEKWMGHYACSTVFACCQIQCPLLFDYEDSKGPLVNLRTEKGAMRALMAIKQIVGGNIRAHFQRGTYDSFIHRKPLRKRPRYMECDVDLVKFKVREDFNVYGEVRDSTAWDGTFFTLRICRDHIRGYDHTDARYSKLKKENWRWADIGKIHYSFTSSPAAVDYRVPMKKLCRSLFRGAE